MGYPDPVRHRLIRALPLLVSAALLVPFLVLAARLLNGEQLARLESGRPNPFAVEHHEAWPWIALAALAALAALVGWWLAERRADRLAPGFHRAEQLEAELAQTRAEHHRVLEDQRKEHEATCERLESRLEEERTARDRAQAARSEERDWNRELRQEVAKAHREHGPLGKVEDIHELVLRLTMQLTDAEKGMLLSRSDSDGDGELDLAAAVGFDADPSDSELAQRFAGEVLARDATVRDDGRDVRDERGTAADREITNLVGIPIYLRDDFHGVVVCANREDGFEDLDDEVLLALGDHAGAILENSRLHGDLRSAYLSTIRLLAEALQVKDPEVRTHSESVTAYVSAVADRVGVSPDRREPLVFGSLLHDVGKLGISERILLKPGRLTPEERSIVEQHPRIGYHLIRQVPALAGVAPAILHHHERFDGAGYPARLAGEDIPLEARIVCVADCFTAMTEQRPYRDPMSWEEACDELERGAGTQFDPEIVRHFVEVVRTTPPVEIEAPETDAELDVLRDGHGPLGGRSFGVVDSLTMLYSHRRLFEVAAAEAHRAEVQDRPFTVVMVELDLDAVNRDDGFGAGDQLLQRVAQALDGAATGCGGTAFRANGRRMAVLAPGEPGRIERAVLDALEPLEPVARVRLGVATWAPGEDGPGVVLRARQSLATAPAPG